MTMGGERNCYEAAFPSPPSHHRWTSVSRRVGRNGQGVAAGPTARDAILELERRVNLDIIGQQQVVERLVIALLANGNVLLEGLPGLAKTRAIKSLSKNVDSEFSRIQFTPDLLPSDVTGGEIYRSDDKGVGTFEFRKGPVGPR
jgi:MoxR-like ATPase